MSLFIPTVMSGRSLDKVENEFYSMMMGHEDQGRERLVLDSRLVATARFRAADMENRRYVAHMDPEGLWPNYHARWRFGFPLPWWYPDHRNTIESITGYRLSMREAFDGFMGSPPHRVHILGGDMFRRQVWGGIGVALGLVHNVPMFWLCVITAEKDPNSE